MASNKELIKYRSGAYKSVFKDLRDFIGDVIEETETDECIVSCIDNFLKIRFYIPDNFIEEYMDENSDLFDEDSDYEDGITDYFNSKCAEFESLRNSKLDYDEYDDAFFEVTTELASVIYIVLTNSGYEKGFDEINNIVEIDL